MSRAGHEGTQLRAAAAAVPSSTLRVLSLSVGMLAMSMGLYVRWVAKLGPSRSKLAQMFGGPDRWGGVNDVVIDDAMGPLVASLITLAFGAGRFSIDYLLHRLVGKRHRSAAEANV